MRFHFGNESPELFFRWRWCKPLHTAQIMCVVKVACTFKNIIDIVAVDKAFREAADIANSGYPMLTSVLFDALAHADN